MQFRCFKVALFVLRGWLLFRDWLRSARRLISDSLRRKPCSSDTRAGENAAGTCSSTVPLSLILLQMSHANLRSFVTVHAFEKVLTNTTKLEGSKQLTPKLTIWHMTESVHPPPSLTTYFPNIRLTNYITLVAEHKGSTRRTPKPAFGYDPTHHPFSSPVFLVTVVMLPWYFLSFLPNGYIPRNSSLPSRQQIGWILPDTVNTVKYSWWWTKTSPETCRPDLQK